MVVWNADSVHEARLARVRGNVIHEHTVAIGARVLLVGDGFCIMREISDDTGGVAEG